MVYRYEEIYKEAKKFMSVGFMVVLLVRMYN